MRLKVACVVLCLPWAGAGCRMAEVHSGGTLPLSRYASQIIDRDPREIVVTVTSPGRYALGGGSTDADGLARAFAQAAEEMGRPAPVAIRAEPAARFGDVWPVVDMAAAHGCRPSFDVRVLGSDGPSYLAFRRSAGLQEPANTVTIRCTKGGNRIGNKPVSRTQLWSVLLRLSSVGRDVPVRILATGDAPYQAVIAILDECESIGLKQRIVGLAPK
jgi:biopolymer transport protein ExbD